MLTKIDWLSFTGSRIPREDETEQSAMYDVSQIIFSEDAVKRVIGIPVVDMFKFKGRPPYSVGMRDEHKGRFVFFHPRLSHFLCELSGRGCDDAMSGNRFWDMLPVVRDRVTRIDVACDMLTDVTPQEFLAACDTKRFRSTSVTISETGVTCTVGSPSSNRHLRVYRYNAPHPRHVFLRAEFTLHRHDARIIVDAILAHTLTKTAAALGETFGLKHPAWDLEPSEFELAAYRPERREAKTLYWLNDTVAPVLVRLHGDGTIDAEHWFAEHVFDVLHPSTEREN